MGSGLSEKPKHLTVNLKATIFEFIFDFIVRYI